MAVFSKVEPDPTALLSRPRTNSRKKIGMNSKWVRQTTKGSIFTTETDKWRLLSKDQVRALDSDSLNRYVQMFSKQDEDDESGADTKRDNNMRQYIRGLEGKQLSDYVNRYT